jgi:hypothetical protein
MSRKRIPTPPTTAAEWDTWTEDDKRELELVLMADQLSVIAYGNVDWRRVAELGRAIVAIAEKRTLALVE